MAGSTETAVLLEEVLHATHEPGQLQRVLNFIGAGGPAAKDADAVRIGVLGASQVATYALIWPAKRRADVVVAAVAARDGRRAKEYAKKHGIPTSYSSYQELIDDPTLKAIYVATPNGLHGDWAAAALKAGKHVLCEKPFAANAAEAKAVQDLSAKKNLVCMEAFHYKFHPANQAVAKLLQSGTIGELQQLEAQVLIPTLFFNKNDIRFHYNLAGGTAMDAGCYCAHALRFFPGCSKPKVLQASASKLLDNDKIDGRMTATLTYPDSTQSSSNSSSGALAANAVGRMEADLRHQGIWPVTHFTAVGTKGRLELQNFIMPPMGHSITLTRLTTDPRSGDNPDRQAGALGDGVRQRFVSDLKVLEDKEAPKSFKRAVKEAMREYADDAVDNMALIDSIYTAAGLPVRQPTHAFIAAGSPQAASMLPLGTKCASEVEY